MQSQHGTSLFAQRRKPMENQISNFLIYFIMLSMVATKLLQQDALTIFNVPSP